MSQEKIRQSDPFATSDSKLHLRFGGKDDTALILAFINELAEYEKLSHEVVADEGSLKQTLFGGRNVAEVVLAFYAEEPVRFALFFHTYSTFLAKPGMYLEDLYVKPSARGNGIGRELLGCLARIALQRDCGRLEWSVLDWNEPAINFYKGLGGQPMDEWRVFRVTGDTLSDLARPPRPGGAPGRSDTEEYQPATQTEGWQK